MNARDLCDLFDGCWSDLPVRIFLDGTEVSYYGGPEIRPADGEPEHYELYLTASPAPAEDGGSHRKEQTSSDA